MTTDTLPSDPKLLMRSIIQRIATGPDLSKDISRTEAHLGTKAIIDNMIDPVQVGIYFIALRMKRETMDENRGVLDAVLDTTLRVTAEVDEVVDIGDPYDGYTRCLPAAPFLGPLLAELGVHVVSHGLDKVGPKFGVTVRHVLEAAGVPVDLTPVEAAARLSDPALGWAQSNPGMHKLIPLRTQMIKRQVLTTVEVLSKPIAGKKLTHFVTGYVHKPYPPVYADLARVAGFDTACIVRGVEGGVIPSLRQTGKYFHYHDRGEEIEASIDPVALGIDQPVRAVPLPGSVAGEAGEDEIVAAIDIKATARAAAEAGILALKGDKGATYDSLVLAGSIVLHHVGKAASVADAAAQIRAVLDSGRAVARVK
ncbi:MAG: anthranilate phosphoribosyltransferase [Hydrogenophilales bacterium 12-61-10]|nr:MAG: anthranilate phosphoribosyltransferase [Hydrogenophilales bacterium 12-61-10]